MQFFLLSTVFLLHYYALIYFIYKTITLRGCVLHDTSIHLLHVCIQYMCTLHTYIHTYIHVLYILHTYLCIPRDTVNHTCYMFTTCLVLLQYYMNQQKLLVLLKRNVLRTTALHVCTHVLELVVTCNMYTHTYMYQYIHMYVVHVCIMLTCLVLPSVVLYTVHTYMKLHVHDIHMYTYYTYIQHSCHVLHGTYMYVCHV